MHLFSYFPLCYNITLTKKMYSKTLLETYILYTDFFFFYLNDTYIIRNFRQKHCQTVNQTYILYIQKFFFLNLPHQHLLYTIF